MIRFKRRVLSLGLFSVLTPLIGCGETAPPSDITNNPAKAEEIAKRRQDERDRTGGTAGAPAGGAAGAPGSGPSAP
jgi:hypothetical protein